jgi:hypothetical protein
MNVFTFAGCSSSDNNDPRASAPQITLTHRSDRVDVSILSTIDGAKILYGVDDRTTPNEYSDIISLTDKKFHKIYAVARKDGYRDSNLSSSAVYPAGAVLMEIAESCTKGGPDSGSLGDNPGPQPTPVMTDLGIVTCGNSSDCNGDIGKFNNWLLFANWVSGNVTSYTDLGTSVYPQQAACNVLGFVIGAQTTNLAKLHPSSTGQIYYGSQSNSNPDPINTSNSVLSVTPPMTSGDFFAGEAGGKMDKCNINTGDCAFGFNNFGNDVTALALDPINQVVWAGTSKGAMMKCSFNVPNSCGTFNSLGNTIQSMAVDKQGNVCVATNQSLLYCPGNQANSCATINSLYPYSGSSNKLVILDNSLYVSNSNSYLQQYPLPLVQGSNPIISYPCGAQIVQNLATDGSNLYFDSGSLTTNIINNTGSCSTWTSNCGSSGCSGPGVEISGVIQRYAMNVNPLSVSPSSLNLQTGTNCTTCTIPPLTFSNAYSDISFPSGAPGSYTTTCYGPQLSCAVNFNNPISVGTSGTINYTDGVTSGSIPYSCSKAGLIASPNSMEVSVEEGCIFNPIQLNNVWGSLTISPSYFILDSSQCTGDYPQSCNITIMTEPGSYPITISDGNSTAQVECNCSMSTSRARK